MRRESDWNQNENKPCFKGEKKNQCLCSGMAKSQPPNRSPCNSVALISATKQNSQRLQGAMAMNLRSRPDITRRALLPGHPLCPFPSLFRSQLRLLPRARLPRPRPQGPGRSVAPDPSRWPCSVRLPGSRSPRSAVPARCTSHRLPPPALSRPSDPSPQLPGAGSLSRDSPVGVGRSWRLLSTHIPTNERAGPGVGSPAERRSVRASAPARPERRGLRAAGGGAEPMPDSGEVPGPAAAGARGSEGEQGIPRTRTGRDSPWPLSRSRAGSWAAAPACARSSFATCTSPRPARLGAPPPPPPRLTAAGRARGAVPWVTWRFPLGLPNPGTSRVGAGCASVRESTPSPHPSQKGFAKYSWDCLASGLSRKQYIASTRLCSADEGSVALPSQPETKMILFSHSSFALSRSFSSLHPSFLPFSLFMFSCSLFSFSFLSWPPSPFSFFLPLSSSVCFPSLLFLSFFSFSWSDQNDVKSYILYWNSPLPPPDSWESSDVCIWRLGDGEWESHRKNRLRCVSALPTKISYVSGPLSF